MPQLDTVYTLMTFMWTWTMIHLMTQKTTTFKMTSPPKKQQTKPNKPTHTPLWL